MEEFDEPEHPLAMMESIIIEASSEEGSEIKVMFDDGEPYYSWSSGDRAFQIALSHPTGVKMLQVVERADSEVSGYNVLRFFYHDNELFAVFRAFLAESEIDDESESRITAQAIEAKALGLPIPNEQDERDFVDYLFSVVGVGPYAE